MPKHTNEKRLERLEQLNPEACILPINQKILIYLATLAATEQKDNPEKYNHHLKTELIRKKEKNKLTPNRIQTALAKNPTTIKALGKGVAAVGAVTAAGTAAGLLSIGVAEGLNKLIEGTVQSAFSGATGGSGFLAAIM
ncbi:MAG: hypothetical protein AAGB33_00090, partial [Cellulomonas sp.]|nr:hypothetical protein [Rickettsiella sp.]